MKYSNHSTTICKNIIWTPYLIQYYYLFNWININSYLLLLRTLHYFVWKNQNLSIKWLVWSSSKLQNPRAVKFAKQQSTRTLKTYTRSFNVMWGGIGGVWHYALTSTILNFNIQRLTSNELLISKPSNHPQTNLNLNKVSYYFKQLNNYFLFTFYTKQYYLLTFSMLNFNQVYDYPLVTFTQSSQPTLHLNSFKFL